MGCITQIEQIKADFIKSRKLLIAIGDETRQTIIMVLMGANCAGLRVGEITAKTHLSRPAVSHHLGILRDCGLVSLSKQGTKNFYSINIGDEVHTLYNLVSHIYQFKDARDSGLFTKEAKDET